MENYLVLNGQKIELTPEQYKEVCNAVSLKKSPFEKREKDETYYYIDNAGIVNSVKDRGSAIDILRYTNANYCSNKELMIRRADYEALERVLWRFSEENGGGGAYFICYDKKIGDWNTAVRPENIFMFGPTFCRKKAASRAIEEAKKWLRENDLKPEDVFF
jgi:hypothetical protein